MYYTGKGHDSMDQAKDKDYFMIKDKAKQLLVSAVCCSLSGGWSRPRGKGSYIIDR